MANRAAAGDGVQEGVGVQARAGGVGFGGEVVGEFFAGGGVEASGQLFVEAGVLAHFRHQAGHGGAGFGRAEELDGPSDHLADLRGQVGGYLVGADIREDRFGDEVRLGGPAAVDGGAAHPGAGRYRVD